MKKHDKYKDSGIAWLGKIPKDWTETKGKYCFDINTGRLDANAEEIDGIYPFFTCSNRIKKINTFAFDCEALLIAGNGDVGYTQYYNGKFNAYQRTYVLRNFSMDVYPIYVKYYFLGLFKQSIETKFVGSVIDFIKVGNLQNFKICFPRLDKQRNIACFLDNKLEVIDKIIDDKKKLIEKLKEYRQATINEAVTKGLDRNASMKDSGVDWIGEIPDDWSITKLRFIATFQNGLSKSGEAFGRGYPFLSYSDVYKNETIPYLSGLVESSEKERVACSVKEGDIFFTRTSETVEEIGISSISTKTIDNATFSGFLIRVRLINKEMLAGFSKYYFGAAIHRNHFVKEMNLVTRASLGQELLKSLAVIIPPEKAQADIISYLDKQNNTINSLINNIEQQIKKLQEFKKSLISEAVTGKIKIEERISEGVI